MINQQVQYLSTLFNSLPNPSMVISAALPFDIVDINDSMASFIGQEKDLLVDKSFLRACLEYNILGIEGYKEEFEFKLQTVVSTKQQQEISEVIWKIFDSTNGTTGLKFFEIQLIPLLNAVNELGHILLYTTDITNKIDEKRKLYFLGAFLENTNDGVLITRAESLDYPDGPIIIFINEAFTKISGYSSDEVIGNTPRMFQGKKTDRAELERLKNALQKKESYEITVINYHKTGREYWVNIAVNPVINNDGVVTHFMAIQRDVTQEINNLTELEEQKLFTEGLLNNIPADIAVFDTNHNYIFINSNGIQNEELRQWMIGKNDYDYFTLKGLDFSMADFRRAQFNRSVEDNTSVDWIDEHISKSGELRYILRRFYPVVKDSKLKYVIGYGIDMTEQQRTRIALEQSEETYSNLFRMNKLPMWLIDTNDYRIVKVNQAAIEFYGYSEEEYLNMTILDHRPPEDIPKVIEFFEEIRKNEERTYHDFFIHQKKSKEKILVEIFNSPISLNGKRYRSVIGIDVTEKKKEEEKIIKAIIEAQENERYEIGGELHDNICQILTSSIINLGLLKKGIPENYIPRLEECKSTLTLAVKEIRNLSHRLAPNFFENITIKESFGKLIRTFLTEEQIDFQLNVEGNEDEKEVNNAIHLNLYRILQEQIRNIIKHAKASLVKIDVFIDSNSICMKIADNGIGMDLKQKSSGIGFANMKRRADFLHGTFEIISELGMGCTISVEIPK